MLNGGIMMLDSIINRLKLSKPWRMNLHGHYDATNDYKRTANYAKQNMSVNGVKELSEQSENEYKNYLQAMENVINEESVNENEKYNQWEKMNRRKNIIKKLCKYSAIALCLFFVLSIIFSKFSYALIWDLLTLFVGVLSCFSLLILIFSILGTFVLKGIDRVFEKKYRDYVRIIEAKFSSVNRQYEHIFDDIYDDIDNLYLNSLEPTHREMVLMRRDQARQHREAMRATAQQVEMQRQIAAEQQQLKQQQEELLRIEREREKRSGY